LIPPHLLHSVEPLKKEKLAVESEKIFADRSIDHEQTHPLGSRVKEAGQYRDLATGQSVDSS
jgi:hypothetical protein